MTIKELRSLSGLSQVKFAEKYNIPRRTIENRETDSRKCPECVMQLLEFKVKTDISNQHN